MNARGPSPAVGGGMKKVLYTLATARRIGLLDAAKALGAKNACKACGLGMGGQRGGMTDELGEFPSVCNKSVQAQSTDIQPPIPEAVFDHSLDELRELTARELETLGRLGHPVYKPAESDRYRLIGWEAALDLAAARLKSAVPDRVFFYSSGRSSNEAGFLFQLFARALGTNNVNNCSYYCHQASGVALGETIGVGTSTVELADLTHCDFILVIGANPASNHPRFIHKLKACRDRGGEVVIVNPAREPGLVRFALPKDPVSLLSGGSDIASDYLQPRIGGDVALLKGLAKAVLEAGGADDDFIASCTDDFTIFRDDIARVAWRDIIEASGVDEPDIRRVAEKYALAESAVFAWGMGITHHVNGVENVECISNLALLRGMIGRRGAGLLPLRGHSNVQGIGTIGVKPVLAEEVMAKMERCFGVDFPKKEGLDTMSAMKAAARGEIDAAVIMGGNLYAANPDSAWAARALDQIAFKLFLTTTLNRGHVIGVDSGEALILPVAARDEEWEPTTQESMFNFVRLSDGGIRRIAEARPESVAIAEIAARALAGHPIDFRAFARHRRIREAIAAIVPGMEALAAIDVAKREFHIPGRILHVPRFATPSGRARFKTRPIPPARRTAPFMLTTARSEGQFNSIIYEEKDAYRLTDTRWAVLMNPDDIAALRLEPGASCDIRSAQGEMRGVKVFAFGLNRGDVLAYYPEANILTSTAADPRSGTPSFKATPVWIEKSPG